jgi:hypothetical protein
MASSWFEVMSQPERNLGARFLNFTIGLKQPEGLERSVSDLECFADYLKIINKFLQNMEKFRPELRGFAKQKKFLV